MRKTAFRDALTLFSMIVQPESPFSAPVRWNCIALVVDCEAKSTFGPKKPASAEEKPGDSLPSLPRPPHREPSKSIAPTSMVRTVDVPEGVEFNDDAELSRRAANTYSSPALEFGLIKHMPKLKIVADLLSEGHSQTEIAEQLGIDRQTVRRRLDSIQKLVDDARATKQKKYRNFHA